MTISPWEGLCLHFPDGELVATLVVPSESFGEVCQGGPIIGDLHLLNGMSISDCNL